jgi:hypothetical protein
MALCAWKIPKNCYALSSQTIPAWNPAILRPVWNRQPKAAQIGGISHGSSVRISSTNVCGMIPSSSPEPDSLWRTYPDHDAEVGLIEKEESDSLLIRHCTSGRSLCTTFLSLRLVLRLDGMRVDDCPDKPRKALLELAATRGVVDLHAAALTTDQPRLSQLPKVLRECGLRNRLVADCQKRRTILRAVLRHDVRINCHPYRVGQGVENALYGDVLNRWMQQRPHGNKSSHSGEKVQ